VVERGEKVEVARAVEVEAAGCLSERNDGGGHVRGLLPYLLRPEAFSIHMRRTASELGEKGRGTDERGGGGVLWEEGWAYDVNKGYHSSGGGERMATDTTRRRTKKR
jgi:hypothetical protein